MVLKVLVIEVEYFLLDANQYCKDNQWISYQFSRNPIPLYLVQQK